MGSPWLTNPNPDSPWLSSDDSQFSAVYTERDSDEDFDLLCVIAHDNPRAEELLVFLLTDLEQNAIGARTRAV